ncbi:MAG: hypothetical protein DRN92_05775 [Thermoproteota archaeon]|nr:MAG: hypothetical protein DRN92_05775 [Candidatus Korarchaeota archaeon]
MPTVPKVATAKFGTLVLDRARVADIAIRAITLAKTMACDIKGGRISSTSLPDSMAFHKKLSNGKGKQDG